MKLLIYLTLWSLSHAAYISRMAAINHMAALNTQNRRPITAFRPGVVLQKPNPWVHQRMVQQAASHRAPYVIYRNNPNLHRYAVKHYTSRPLFASATTTAWKGARPAVTGTTEFEFLRAASAAPHAHLVKHDGGTGAIHTIPAPNLSLSEKPIVVLDSNNVIHSTTSEAPKIRYEVTEKYPDTSKNQVAAKIEQPIGFSKATSLTSPELEQLVRNGAALQLASELGLSAFALPQVVQSPALAPQPFHQAVVPPSVVQAQVLPHRSIIPHQFSLQTISNTPQDILRTSPDGIFISPNALYQPDPAFLQKLQNQLLQRFPGIEFVPYPADIQPTHFQTQTPRNHQSPQPEVQSQIPKIQLELQAEATQTQEPIFLLQNEQITRQTPSSFVTSENRVVQREAQEGNVVTLVPQGILGNLKDNQIEVTSLEPLNITVEIVPAESQHSTTATNYVTDASTKEQTTKTTPVFYSSGNVVTDGFYSAINDVRAAAAAAQLSQMEKPQEQQTQMNTQQTQTNTQQIQQNMQNIQQIVQQMQQNTQQIQQNTQQIQTNTQQSQMQQNTQQNTQQIPTNTQQSQMNAQTTETNTLETQTTTQNSQQNMTTTTLDPELKPYFVQTNQTIEANQTANEIKPLLGVPFAKPSDAINVGYALVSSNLETDDKDSKVAKDGSVYKGQIVEATITEDHEFNREKAALMHRRAPLRLMVTDKKEKTTTTTNPPKIAVLRSRMPMPPRSKLTIDDKTGEPVLRIYASYLDTSPQKDTVASKLSTVKQVKENRKQDTVDSWNSASVKGLDKSKGFDVNQVTQFGLKLKERSDDYVPLFDEYEE